MPLEEDDGPQKMSDCDSMSDVRSQPLEIVRVVDESVGVVDGNLYEEGSSSQQLKHAANKGGADVVRIPVVVVSSSSLIGTTLQDSDAVAASSIALTAMPRVLQDKNNTLEAGDNAAVSRYR
jgi:hypothetical protein